MKVLIIGGGASGMAAALSAARDPANSVTLLERQARVGRKLLATGNGRCNLTNRELGSIPSPIRRTASWMSCALRWTRQA